MHESPESKNEQAATNEARDAGIKNENALINQRLTWLGTFQGFLVAALFLGLGGGSLPTFFLVVVAFLGAATSASIGLGTIRANRVIERLERELADAFTGYRNRGDLCWWLMPGYFLPWLFFTFWLATLVYVLGGGELQFSTVSCASAGTPLRAA